MNADDADQKGDLNLWPSRSRWSMKRELIASNPRRVSSGRLQWACIDVVETTMLNLTSTPRRAPSFTYSLGWIAAALLLGLALLAVGCGPSARAVPAAVPTVQLDSTPASAALPMTPEPGWTILPHGKVRSVTMPAPVLVTIPPEALFTPTLGTPAPTFTARPLFPDGVPWPTNDPRKPTLTAPPPNPPSEMILTVIPPPVTILPTRTPTIAATVTLTTTPMVVTPRP